MRFAEFSLQYRKANTQILTFPSAFTVTTGLAHWHALLRARAIETQCYVVAAAQTGQHNSKRSSFGHALVIDPWGAVVAEVSEGTGIALAEIDLKYLAKVRREMPVLSHRRNDLYSLHSQSLKLGLTEILPFPRDFVTYPFGQVSIPGNCIFLQTLACNAFVNKKPFTPGHVLIAPQKTILRLCDLEDREICDFAQTLVLALLVLVDKYSPSHVQLAIQDGECAGRTINHVHAHLLPVTDGETLLEKHEEKDSREWRSAEDMASEATELRQSTIKVRKNSDWLSSTNIPTSLHTKDPLGNGPFRVGEMFLTAEKIFFFTGTCFAFLAGDPVLPGHICICPCDPVSSLSHLSPGEVSDIFLSIQKIQQVIEVCFDVSSSTIFVNDGSKGLCVHIVPRKEGDLKRNDDLYSMLSGYELRASGESSDELLLRLKESLGPTTTVEKV
ncbi:UNVERIFIED_CONTAM: hypothetical protein GTU68_032641 [Idotea baltica]|nr:hypothetical protein [Idotea baltica]